MQFTIRARNGASAPIRSYRVEAADLDEAHFKLAAKGYEVVAEPPASSAISAVPECPQCRNTNIIRASAAYEQGTSTSGSRSVGLAATSDKLIPVVTSTRGTQQTMLAKRLAPPVRADRAAERTKLLWVLGVMSIVAGGLAGAMSNSGEIAAAVGGVALLSVIATAIGSIATIKRLRWEDEMAHASAMLQYHATWYCPKCGAEFPI